MPFVATLGTLVLAAGGLSAVSQAVLAGAAIVAGGWAVYNYRKRQRAEAARWLQGLFKDFYSDSKLLRGRELIEYDYRGRLEHLVTLRVTARHVELSEMERDDLRDLDLVLNYFEQLVYLEQEGHISPSDRSVFFEYWFDLLREPGHAALRRYLARCGYEKCSQALGIPTNEYVVFYGSLMSPFRALDDLGMRDKLRLVGPCEVNGSMYDKGDWPSVVAGDGVVHGELWELLDLSVLPTLDSFERFDPADRAESGYVRRCVRLEGSGIDAWVYFANEPVEADPEVSSGSWVEYARGKGIGDWRDA